ncbi:MAG TPA: hypothetical protein VJZ27_08260, partial [Aggregatilineales bacterium]|nr:hypothetical protein [Aggregatilineales bacterium]
EAHWMPVFVIQIMFSCLQVAWFFELPANNFLLAISVVFSLIGLSQTSRWAQFTALTGGAMTLFVWLIFHDITSSLGILVVSIAALTRFRRWEWIAPIYAAVIWLGILLEINPMWGGWMALAIVHLAIGSYLVMRIRMQESGYRTLESIMIRGDWAAPFLWFGLFFAGLSIVAAMSSAEQVSDMAGVALLIGIFSIFPVMWLRLPRLTNLPVALLIIALVLNTIRIETLQFEMIGGYLGIRSILMMTLALGSQYLSILATRSRRPFASTRWLVWWVRPLMKAGSFLAVIGFGVGLVTTLYQQPPYLVFMIDCLLATSVFALIYVKTQRMNALVLSLGLFTLAWGQILANLSFALSPLLILLPAGLILIVLAPELRSIELSFGEGLGAGILILGGMAELERPLL